MSEQSGTPDTTAVPPVPRVEWDAEVGAIYLRLTETRPEQVATLELEGGTVMVDMNYYGDEIIGVEMLAEPHGDDRHALPAHVWVLAAKAWLLAQPNLRSGKAEKWTGSFTLAGAEVTGGDRDG